MKKITIFLSGLLLLTAFCQAQIRKVPSEVTNAFTARHTGARNVSWKDNLTNFEAKFTHEGVTCTSKFTPKGEWLETTRSIGFNQLNHAVRDGFHKSKFSDWHIRETKELQEKDKEVVYRIYVSKSDVQKKYLYFNAQGQLVRDALTI